MWEAMLAPMLVMEVHVQVTRMRVVVPTNSDSKEGLVGEWKEVWVGTQREGGQASVQRLMAQG